MNTVNPLCSSAEQLLSCLYHTLTEWVFGVTKASGKKVGRQCCSQVINGMID